MDCGRCQKDDCNECCKIIDECRQICGDDCLCLCVFERLNNKIDGCDLMDDNFKLGCGSKMTRKLIEQLRRQHKIINDLKTELVCERIQYKATKDKQDKLITKQGLQIAEIVKQLNYKGFAIKNV